MNYFRLILSRLFSWRTTPYAVALAGLLATAVLVLEVASSDKAHLEQRFENVAKARTETIVRPFENQLATFSVLQRAFHTMGEINEQKFEQILGPLIWTPGLRGFAWAPRVEAAGRAAFEAQGKQHWGESFAVSTIGAGGTLQPAPERDFHFPVQFQNPLVSRRLVHGLDLYSMPGRSALIE